MDFSWITTDLIVALGPVAGVLILSIFFIKSFIRYNEKVMLSMIDEMKEDRQQQKSELNVFKQAIEKIDRRLEIMENLLKK